MTKQKTTKAPESGDFAKEKKKALFAGYKLKVDSLNFEELLAYIRIAHADKQRLIVSKNKILLTANAIFRTARIKETGKPLDEMTDAEKKKVNTAASADFKEVEEQYLLWPSIPQMRKFTRVSPERAYSIDPYFESIKLFEEQIADSEKRLAYCVRKLPVYGWVKSIKGFGDSGFGSIIGELGDLSTYTKKVHGIWKRMGLAVIDGERQRKCREADKAIEHGYAPRRRSIMWNVGGSIIGSMGRGPRPRVGEDVSKRDDLTDYQKLFIERCRIEAVKFAAMPPTKDGKTFPLLPPKEKDGVLLESYRAGPTARAKRYVEKRLLRDLYRQWVGQPLGDDWKSPEQLKHAA